MSNHLPFDVTNLDFSSQDPSFDEGRVEKEIISIEKTIKLQKTRYNNNFILIYTTILNSNNLNLTFLCGASDALQVAGWQGLKLDGYPVNISDNNQKINCIENLLYKITKKYNYHCNFNKINLPLNEHKVVFSICGLLKSEGI